MFVVGTVSYSFCSIGAVSSDECTNNIPTAAKILCDAPSVVVPIGTLESRFAFFAVCVVQEEEIGDTEKLSRNAFVKALERDKTLTCMCSTRIANNNNEAKKKICIINNNNNTNKKKEREEMTKINKTSIKITEES